MAKTAAERQREARERRDRKVADLEGRIADYRVQYDALVDLLEAVRSVGRVYRRAASPRTKARAGELAEKRAGELGIDVAAIEAN